MSDGLMRLPSGVGTKARSRVSESRKPVLVARDSWSTGGSDCGSFSAILVVALERSSGRDGEPVSHCAAIEIIRRERSRFHAHHSRVMKYAYRSISYGLSSPPNLPYSEVWSECGVKVGSKGSDP